MDIGKENKARELYTRAMKYIYGDGVEENTLLAVRFLEESHRLGLPEATYNLGICYHYGYGVSPDPEIAFSL